MNIIELARDHASRYTNRHYPDRPVYTFHQDALERFAALVRAQALEEAAGVCEQYAKHKLEEEMPIAYVYGARECAESIRWMKEQT